MTTLHDLADRWERHAVDMRDELNSEGFAVAREMCAAELRAALAETGWRSMDDCPSDHRLIWIWCDGKVKHGRADGSYYRWCLRKGCTRTPTMWHPCEVPPPPGEPA